MRPKRVGFWLSLGATTAACASLPESVRVAASTSAAAPATAPAAAGGPVILFQACGVLRPGPQGCPTFVLDDGTSFFVDNTGGFGIGDRVWVRGALNPQTLLCFPILGAGIENAEVFECFEDCGVIGTGPQGCPILTVGDQFYFMESVPPDSFGARVWVQGCLNPQSQLCAPLSGPGIESNTVGECFMDCGTLIFEGDDCRALELENGTRVSLQNAGAFQPGDRVWVEGCLGVPSFPPLPPTPCEPIDRPVVRNNRIAECFEGCGELVPGFVCTLFLADDGRALALEDYGDFAYGESVWVQGCFNPESALCPPLPSHPGVERNTIGRCFKGCGLVTVGPQGCPILTTTDGLLFVEHVDPDLLNERVWVTGCLNPQSTICLPPGGPAIEDNRMGPCIEVCGRVIRGPECILFRGDDEVTYFLPNIGLGLGLVGKRLRVTGCLGPEITPCSIDQPFPQILDSINELLGDLNCDGLVTVSDIAPFVIAITNPAQYGQLFPDCDLSLADMNCDGVATVGDIGLFVSVLANATDPPEGG